MSKAVLLFIYMDECHSFFVVWIIHENYFIHEFLTCIFFFFRTAYVTKILVWVYTWFSYFRLKIKKLRKKTDLCHTKVEILCKTEHSLIVLHCFSVKNNRNKNWLTNRFLVLKGIIIYDKHGRSEIQKFCSLRTLLRDQSFQHSKLKSLFLRAHTISLCTLGVLLTVNDDIVVVYFSMAF